MEKFIENFVDYGNGLVQLGIHKDNCYESLIVLNFNNNTIVFNNSNTANAGVWTEKTLITNASQYQSELWYKAFKKLLASGKITKLYVDMIEKINNGEINVEKEKYCPFANRICDRAEKENADIESVCCIGCEIYAMYTLSKG